MRISLLGRYLKCAVKIQHIPKRTQIAKFMGPTWGPPGSCRPQMGPMSAPWNLLSGNAQGFAICFVVGYVINSYSHSPISLGLIRQHWIVGLVIVPVLVNFEAYERINLSQTTPRQKDKKRNANHAHNSSKHFTLLSAIPPWWLRLSLELYHFTFTPIINKISCMSADLCGS